MKYYLFSLLALASLGLLGQNEQAAYLEAKRLFNNRQYLSARAIFGNLSRSNSAFAPYAGFYYGLSAHKLGDKEEAVGEWEQVLNRFPNWDQQGELLYWLAYSSLQSGLYEKGIQYSDRLTEASLNITSEKTLLKKFILPLSIDTIGYYLGKYPENKELAELYILKNQQIPYTSRDYEFVDSLKAEFDFGKGVLEFSSLPVIKKDRYEVAALLPFMFGALDNPGRILQNSLVTDLYQGMLLAVEDLEARGKPLDLIPYDTKRSEQVTSEILKSPGFEQTDLIVGPLFSDPVKAAQNFTLENQINMINPVSSTSEIIGRNPFSFLFKPSAETQAKKLAELVIAEVNNRNAMIFYEANSKDSLFAATYKEAIEDAGFEVIWMQPIGEENAKLILDTLVAQFDVYLTKDEADSVMTIPDRVVKTRRVREDELKRLAKQDPNDSLAFYLPISYDENDREIVYYEEQFYMEKDSIGHFFGATRSNTFGNSLISSVEIRGDSTKIYTYGNWLEFTMADFNQFERLGVTMAYPEFINKERISYQEISDRIIDEYKTLPSQYHLTGYEMIWYLGHKLHSHGKYFQLGIRKGDFFNGKIYEGIKYGSANDNQVVPIVRFNNNELEIVNKDLYGN